MEKEEIKAIQRQMANAANELDALRAMMDRWPEKQKELRGASDILAEWEIEIMTFPSEGLKPNALHKHCRLERLVGLLYFT